MNSISIITATYNAERTLSDCIKSVSSQTVPAEHIIVDGSSSDSTLEILKQNRHAIEKVISEPDNGIYDAMNKGIAAASGSIIGILNADDYYADNTVLESVCRVFEDPSVQACYGDLYYVSAEKPEKIVRNWKSGTYDLKKFYWGWMPPHPTFFVRKQLYDNFGRFNLDLGSAADYELMLRLLLKNKVKAEYIPKVLVHMRAGGVSNVSIKNRLAANRMDKKAWSINGLRPLPWTFIAKPVMKLTQWIIWR